MTLSPFHLAIPVDNLPLARAFYGEVLQLAEGRSSKNWVDFNFFGHQLVIHYQAGNGKSGGSNPVDGHQVPVPHFGLVMPWGAWHELADRLKSIDIEFVIKPYIRFAGEIGEQATMFFHDPCGNALEFKAFKDPSQLFAR